MKARDIDGAILTGAISATIGDREKALGLPLPGVGGREGLPASLAVTYDKAEYGEASLPRCSASSSAARRWKSSLLNCPPIRRSSACRRWCCALAMVSRCTPSASMVCRATCSISWTPSSRRMRCWPSARHARQGPADRRSDVHAT